MNKQQFQEKMSLFERYYEITLDGDILRGYKERYINLDYNLFDKMINHIFNTFKSSYSKKHPNYVDFNAAKDHIMQEINNKKPQQPTIKPRYSSETSKMILELAEKFKTKNEDKVMTQRELLRTMFKNDMIFSIKLWKWVKRGKEKEIGGKFTYPEEKIPELLGSKK